MVSAAGVKFAWEEIFFGGLGAASSYGLVSLLGRGELG